MLKKVHNFVTYTTKMDGNCENLGSKMMKNESAMEWGTKNDRNTGNVL